MRSTPVASVEDATQLRKEAVGLINFVSTCTRADGLLCGWVDPKSGRRDSHHLLPDFGDWAPFFLYFDRPELAQRHLEALPEYLDRSGILRAQERRFGLPVI